MRDQWITRLLANSLVVSDAVMEPFAREVLDNAAARGMPLVLIMDQSKVSERHQVLMLALRFGERALPLAWRVEATAGDEPLVAAEYADRMRVAVEGGASGGGE